MAEVGRLPDAVGWKEELQRLSVAPRARGAPLAAMPVLGGAATKGAGGAGTGSQPSGSGKPMLTLLPPLALAQGTSTALMEDTAHAPEVPLSVAASREVTVYV